MRELSRKTVAVNGEVGSIAYWYEKVRGHELHQDTNGIMLKSGPICLSCEAHKGQFKGLSGVHAVLYGSEPMDAGRLCLFRNRLVFQGASHTTSIPFESISSVTIESNTVIVDRNSGPTLYFDFLKESGKKWEDSIQKVIADFYHPRHIAEFCPKIRFAQPRGIKENKNAPFHHVHVAVNKWYKSDPPPISVVLKKVADTLVRGLLDIRLTGMDHIPQKGAAIVAANHVSLLDGIILGACLPRLTRFMTKNSPFQNPIIRKVLMAAGAFPVKRYRTDVIAVRNAWRVLQEDHLLGVFPEGERSWDGQMLPFKKGTLRLIMAAGKPLIPVGISGIYELMPRWTHRIKKVPIRINVGKPMRFASISIVDQTKEDVSIANKRLKEALQQLIV